jgi:hypothetical protein
VDRVVNSDSAGNYSVPSLLPGDYSVAVQAPGFAAYKLTSVSLSVDQNVTANVHLSLATMGEVVNVQGAAPIIDAQTMTVGQVIDQRTVQEMPLNGRHFLDLTNLTPGTVVPPVTGNLTSASRGRRANSFDTAGQRDDSVNFMINGINLNDGSQNQITFQPSIGGVQDFEFDLLGGVRTIFGLDSECSDSIGNEHLSWRSVRLSSQQLLRRPKLL